MSDSSAILTWLTFVLVLTTGCDHFHTPAVPFGPAGSIAVAVRSSNGEVVTWFGGGEPPEIETCLYDFEDLSDPRRSVVASPKDETECPVCVSPYVSRPVIHLS